jgi:hypothetical protein
MTQSAGQLIGSRKGKRADVALQDRPWVPDLTGDGSGVYTFFMKIRVILILLLFLSYLTPSSIHIQLDTSHPEQPVMVTLDVCHMADAPLKGGVDLPSITPQLTMIPLPLPSGDLKQRPFACLMTLKPQPEERPPRRPA